MYLLSEELFNLTPSVKTNTLQKRVLVLTLGVRSVRISIPGKAVQNKKKRSVIIREINIVKCLGEGPVQGAKYSENWKYQQE